MGFKVVRARRNATMPDTAMLRPRHNSARATPRRRLNGMARDPARAGISHMRIAKNRATRGGGIFSSRAFMEAIVPEFPIWLVVPHILHLSSARNKESASKTEPTEIAN